MDYLNADGSWNASQPIPKGCTVEEFYDAQGLVSRRVTSPSPDNGLTPGTVIADWKRPT